jgi:hypothetical protein
LSLWGKAVNDVNYVSGRWTYVLYDPDRPDRCEIDMDRLAKEFGLCPDGNRPHLMPRDAGHLEFKVTGPVADARTPEPGLASGGLIADLSRLADPHASGALSNAEFAEAKARLLDQSKHQ